MENLWGFLGTAFITRKRPRLLGASTDRCGVPISPLRVDGPWDRRQSPSVSEAPLGTAVMSLWTFVTSVALAQVFKGSRLCPRDPRPTALVLTRTIWLCVFSPPSPILPHPTPSTPRRSASAGHHQTQPDGGHDSRLQR